MITMRSFSRRDDDASSGGPLSPRRWRMGTVVASQSLPRISSLSPLSPHLYLSKRHSPFPSFRARESLSLYSSPPLPPLVSLTIAPLSLLPSLSLFLSLSILSLFALTLRLWRYFSYLAVPILASHPSFVKFASGSRNYMGAYGYSNLFCKILRVPWLIWDANCIWCFIVGGAGCIFHSAKYILLIYIRRQFPPVLLQSPRSIYEILSKERLNRIH